MILISHRGNMNGIEKTKENTIEQINLALSKGYDVEVDVWYENGSLYLGHDKPEEKVDLEFPNHLAGEKPIYLKLSFTNVQNLMTVRKLILQAVEKNGKNRSTEDIYANFVSNGNEADIKIWKIHYNERWPVGGGNDVAQKTIQQLGQY